MRHVPFFRWVLTLGCVLFACSVGLYAGGQDLPEARQIDLTVLDEKPDGSCRVRWIDPYQKRAREASHQCDPGRSDLLKAPQYSDSRGYGWESGFMLTEGSDRGNLEDLAAEPDLGYSDVFLLLGAPLIALGLLGGNLRALPGSSAWRRGSSAVRPGCPRPPSGRLRTTNGLSPRYGRRSAAVSCLRLPTVPWTPAWSRRFGYCGKRAHRRARRRFSAGSS